MCPNSNTDNKKHKLQHFWAKNSIQVEFAWMDLENLDQQKLGIWYHKLYNSKEEKQSYLSFLKRWKKCKQKENFELDRMHLSHRRLNLVFNIPSEIHVHWQNQILFPIKQVNNV